MPKNKNSVDIDDLKRLCDFDGEKYISKEGFEYIEALKTVFNLINANDKPFTVEDIMKQPLINEFEFDGVKEFVYICDLEVKPLTIMNDVRRNEKIIANNFTSLENKKIFDKSMGVAYMLTCVIGNREYIIKIGSTRTAFKQRLGSYNCGVVNNWRTASTTNIKILQSMVTTRKKLKLYIYDCSEVKTYIWHGVESVPFATTKNLAVEDIMIKKFVEQFNKKPLANVQAGATEV